MAIWIRQIVQFIVFFYMWQYSVAQLLFINTHRPRVLVFCWCNDDICALGVLHMIRPGYRLFVFRGRGCFEGIFCFGRTSGCSCSLNNYPPLLTIQCFALKKLPNPRTDQMLLHTCPSNRYPSFSKLSRSCLWPPFRTNPMQILSFSLNLLDL